MVILHVIFCLPCNYGLCADRSHWLQGCIFLKKSNPLLFAESRLRRTKTRPKYSERVVFLAPYEKKFFSKMIEMPIKLLKKEWSEHKIKAISVLSVLENPCAVYLFGFLYEL